MARSPEAVAVNVRLRAVSGAGRAFACPGILQATQTFPDEKDDDLARLYVLKVAPEQLASVIQSLRADPDIELAEEAGAKRLTPRWPRRS